MDVHLLKSKIHRARITECVLDYEGSLGIDMDLVDAVGLLPYERVLVVNQTNGERLETYVIPAERGSGTFCLNGAAAHRGKAGDLITIMAFASVPAGEAGDLTPRIVVLDDRNRIAKRRQ